MKKIIQQACQREHRAGTASIWLAERCATFVDAATRTPCHRVDRVIKARGWDTQPPRIRNERTGDVTTRRPDEVVNFIRGAKGPGDIFSPIIEGRLPP